MANGSKSKKLFIAQSASESEAEGEGQAVVGSKKIIKPANAAKNKNSIVDSSEEEEEDEEMTKEDLEFLKNDTDSESDSGSVDSGSSETGSVSPDELSDDDLELIEENLGKRRSSGPIRKTSESKFKRLRRRNEIDSSESSEEFLGADETIKKTGTFAKERDLQNLFNDEVDKNEYEEGGEGEGEEEDVSDLDDFIEEDDIEEDEDELPGTIDEAIKYRKQQQQKGSNNKAGIPRRRAIIDDNTAAGPKRALSSALASGQISKAAWDEMMEIFGDGTDYIEMVIESDEEQEEENEEGNFEESGKDVRKLKESMANLTTSTTSTAVTAEFVDMPERLVNLEIFGDSQGFENVVDDELLQKESNFIARKIQKLCRADSFSSLSSAILSVLRFIHQHGLEVPFIATYRKEYFTNILTINEIWTILDEDFKYRQCTKLKKKIQEKLGENYDADFFDVENEWDESQLQFINEFLIRRRTKNSNSSSKTANLLDFAHKITPSAAHFAENLRKQRILHGPLILSEIEMENEAVELVAREIVPNVEAAISAAKNALAEEYGMHPQLFSEIKDSLMNHAMITVTPTALGSIEISNDPTHYLLPMQYVTEKNISAFIEDQGLALTRGLDAKLITVEISYGKNFDTIMRDIQQYLPGIEEFKRSVFDSAWKDHWMPRLNRLILQRLRSEAENWVAHFNQFYFQEKLMTSPLNLACETLADDEIAIVSVNFVKETLHFVEMDKFGRVLRQESVKVKNAIRPEAVFRKSITTTRVPYVIVSGEGQDCLEFYRDLRESKSFERNSIAWGCDDTAQIFKNSMRAAREFPECLVELKYAVGVGRRMLNPVVEFSMMSEDELLQLPLHALQNHLPRALRLKHIQRALVNVVNLVGVPINELILPGARQGMLSYVSGLGPQKAAQLSKKMGNKWLQSRADLITQYDMGRRTFTNAAGFIKITPERLARTGKKKSSSTASSSSSSLLIEPLDGTRIHPESYELARKMAADALELDDPSTMKRRQDIFGDDEEDEENGSGDSSRASSILAGAIIQIMKESRKLDDLILADYAKEIEKLTHLPKLKTLEEIKSELQGSLPDPRSKINDISKLTPVNQVVRMLTGKDENWWYPGRPVMIKLVNPTSRKLAVLIEANGLLVGVTDEIPRNARHGQPIPAFLTGIDLKKLIIDVNLKRPGNLEELLMKNVTFDAFYNFQRPANQGGAVNSTHNTPNLGSQNVATVRQLSHPAFKNFNREEAENFLALAPVGEVLIRPSSQKRGPREEIPGDLTLTWKVGPGLYSHVPLGELERPVGQDWNLGRVLLLPALIPDGVDKKMKVDKFEDFDEIVGRRIEPVLSLLQEVQGCPKYFSNPGSEAINQHLKDQMSINPGRIPYCITLATEPHCGHLFLSHPGGNRLELIRVDPRGYALTDPRTKETKIFERIEKLVDYFKRNYKNFSEKDVAGETANRNNVSDKNITPGPTKPRDDPRTKYQQFA